MAAPGVAVEVAISGTLAFVASREEGLHIVDVSNPAQPQPDDLRHAGPGVGRPWRAWVYLADGPAGVRLLDVSDPARPRETAAYVTPGYAWNVVVAGDQVVVAAESGGLPRGGRPRPAPPVPRRRRATPPGEPARGGKTPRGALVGTGRQARGGGCCQPPVLAGPGCMPSAHRMNSVSDM
ncbi:MAG: hypothetical protein IPO15_14590 [Anaerolineae bacterium]|uniref:hypothetical protein n=1 Tax=Candidatus Amarolinea dominans TaxID=3140696 RepID=UPI003134BD81|nr:hypothetical protein [Anaerolineae bacterium]